jgi:molecular chaperone DnaJ
MKITGKGEAGRKGGPHGDLYVQIKVAEHKKFVRDGANIRSVQHIHVLQAILGDKIEIDTIHGKKKIKIPQGLTPGQIIKLEDLGAPKLNSYEKGNHLLEVIIDIPKKLSKKEKELYMDLAKQAGLNPEDDKKGIFG